MPKIPDKKETQKPQKTKPQTQSTPNAISKRKADVFQKDIVKTAEERMASLEAHIQSRDNSIASLEYQTVSQAEEAAIKSEKKRLKKQRSKARKAAEQALQEASKTSAQRSEIELCYEVEKEPVIVQTDDQILAMRQEALKEWSILNKAMKNQKTRKVEGLVQNHRAKKDCSKEKEEKRKTAQSSSNESKT